LSVAAGGEEFFEVGHVQAAGARGLPAHAATD
jgi:hypothetical protein